MARSSSVERTVQILDFLTTHPGRGFTVSETSRRLLMSKATAHRILGSLADRALVTRNPSTQEYRLGPALVPMGNVAARNVPALAHAKREAEQLADRFDGECVLVMATGQELLVIGHAGVPSPESFALAEGQRQPLAPPMGTVLLAWMNDQAVDDWLARMGSELTDGERDRYRSGIEMVRQRGFAVVLRVPKLNELHELYGSADLYTPHGREEINAVLAALAHDEYLLVADELPSGVEIGSVAAPVFDPNRNVLFAIALMPPAGAPDDVRELSRAVTRAAQTVTAAIDGRSPGTKSKAFGGPV
jgi:DNA-binding IclR family transcriptional regulator